MDKYHGQYNFLGRLTKPIVFTDSKLLAGWLRDNPKSKIVSYHYSSPEKNFPEYFQTFRGRYIAVWNGANLRKNPKIAFPGKLFEVSFINAEKGRNISGILKSRIPH